MVLYLLFKKRGHKGGGLMTELRDRGAGYEMFSLMSAPIVDLNRLDWFDAYFS